MAFLDVCLGALVALTATSAGASVVLAFNKLGKTGFTVLLSFSAGVMAFSALEMLSQSHSTAGDATVAVGILVGILVLFASDKLIPHLHARIRGREITASKKKAALIAGAITIHNVPEGFAIASAFAGATPLGWLVTASIALQDIPEGFMISAPLAAYGVENKRALWFGVLSGLVEAVSAIICYLVLSSFNFLVPFALSFSGGAMAYVIFAELLPDAFRNGMERIAALSFVAGAATAFGIAAVFAF